MSWTMATFVVPSLAGLSFFATMLMLLPYPARSDLLADTFAQMAARQKCDLEISYSKEVSAFATAYVEAVDNAGVFDPISVIQIESAVGNPELMEGRKLLMKTWQVHLRRVRIHVLLYHFHRKLFSGTTASCTCS